ncbi:PAS-domain containing protein [Stappia sp. 28M-7]|uniref:hybrid sensor histidine kinase/response regulator n=1 Tax=Stappia sp. 28M-7 TaxID=2762596 RepID=UPI00163C61CD|nr:PAS-domain containing protein [Stappia sp. 28M-7]MBC2861164.1 PAS-domain containing protein [Stappia sp. 28M-7]
MTRRDLYRERLDLLQAALDHINQGFSVFDADLRLVAWNRQLFSMLEFPWHLARRGTHLSAFLEVNAARGEYGPGDVGDIVARRVERAKLFEPHTFERVRPDGQVVMVTGAPLPEGGFVTTYTDITRERQHQASLERTVAERTHQLRQSEDWLRLVTENIPALVAYISPGPIYRFANRRYAKWFDQTVESIAGRHVGDILGPDLYARLEPHIEKAFQGQAVSYEYSRTRPTGVVAHMRSTLIPDRTLDGRVLGCFVLSLDATEQKRSEAALAQAQRMEAVGQLTGGLAHDFNNLLTIIIGNVLALRRKVDLPAMPDLAMHLDPIHQAAQRGADLTRRLLAFARGDASDVRPLRLAPLTANVEGLLAGSLPKSVELVLDLAACDAIVRIDPAEFENALVNLVLNARDAMPSGGTISISLTCADLNRAEADRFGVMPGAHALLEVRDNGEGMSEEVRRQAFDPFFSTKPFGTGSGLGLPTVYGCVRRSGGGILIDSTPGEGTVIRLAFPVIDAEPGQHDNADGEPAADGNGELVLVVDDDTDVADVVRDQLCALGYSVLVTGSTDDALDLVRDVEDIRAVLSDIVMPGQTNGIALVAELRKRRPGLPVALMTGYRQGPTLEAQSPDCPVLPKPFSSRLLARTMNEILAS